MKYLTLLVILCLFQTISQNTSGTVSQEPIVAPTVKHEKKTETQEYDYVMRSCPDGYEGHFVAVQPDFYGSKGGSVVINNVMTFGEGGELMYTICFKKEFMDKIRKNPELLTTRPVIKPV